MKVLFRPPAKIFEGTPLEVKIEERILSDNLQLGVTSLGKIPLKCQRDSCHGFFTFPRQGSFQLMIRQGPTGKVLWQTQLQVAEAKRIEFTEEMGIFIPLLILILTGILVWTIRKHRQTYHRT